MTRPIRSEAALAQILARPGYRLASQIGGENASTSGPELPAVTGAVHSVPSGKAPGPLTQPLYAVVLACRMVGLPEPVAEYQFHPTRRWRFDYAWPLHRLALEIEGGVWTEGRHTRGSGFLADMRKYNAAAIMGWRILRYSPQTMGAFTADVREAITP